mmetsp:Transcript_22374/g.28958  ORF Transcript_22374/g.28958 Transcript_22374/m.28958 type:complete len:785 (-) Transcript_22374:160-2514(-)|eukprot:CAMPEP_0197287612 /NCGR_PEP_ID=MMETSP0890-20130614/4176_1 /TAXON_ID=44058 ORGANISM="Aureoumbra lagunensis, Strain CCMP1510" /NCGR_SAMPLE_ID=MMETSP0890 /ASSEMBLY_ACC=CAM_ASM_000533 /LENGTH=784 /DNA_ID=CAMNT_0042757511 /DNA_START=78 /DNA_END=2432 /DNA_ORIENTATION=-
MDDSGEDVIASRPNSLSIDNGDMLLNRGPVSDDTDERRSRWSTGSTVGLGHVENISLERGAFRGNVTSPFLLHQFAEKTSQDALLPSLREAAAALCRTADRETLHKIIEILQQADPRNRRRRHAFGGQFSNKKEYQQQIRSNMSDMHLPIMSALERGSSAPNRAAALPPRQMRRAPEIPRAPPSPPYATMNRNNSDKESFYPPKAVQDENMNQPPKSAGNDISISFDINSPSTRISDNTNEAKYMDNHLSRSVEQVKIRTECGVEMRRSASTPALRERSDSERSESPRRYGEDFSYRNRESASTAMLRELADASSAVKLGLDLGGSLTKLVIASPLVNGQNHSQAACRAARADDALKLKVLLADGQATVLHFAKASTDELEDVLKALADPPRLDNDEKPIDTNHDIKDTLNAAKKSYVNRGGTGNNKAESYMTATIVENTAEDESDDSSSDDGNCDDKRRCQRIRTRKDSGEHEGRRIVAAGGGAHKLRGKFRLALGIELTPFREMQSVVDGLLLLHELGVEDEVYKVQNVSVGDQSTNGGFFSNDQEYPNQKVPAEVFAAWPKPLLPLLLVNVGSGVSCLLVTREGYARIGGTAIGGATFLGLARALTPARTFDEAIELAAAGNAAKVDTLVGDIYGDAGCVDLGLPPSLTAASFGKLARSDTNYSPADVCRALLEMVAQSCCVLARAHASQLGCRQRVFFAGGFVDGNPLARATIANSLRSLGGRAHFLRHSDFLGALGATAMCLSGGPKQKVLQMPSSDRYDHVLDGFKAEVKSEETYAKQ